MRSYRRALLWITIAFGLGLIVCGLMLPALQGSREAAQLAYERQYGDKSMEARAPALAPGPNAQLWVIEKGEPTPAAEGIGGYQPEVEEQRPPTQGELRAVREDKEVPLPLKHTDVHASVEAFLATVEVTQQYENPFDTKIEAVYVFPLPQSAAVTDFLMKIGDRTIRGVIREKEEAKRIYEQAKRQGYRASLLTQERPNIFRQKVANIEPGKGIDVSLTYFNPLRYVDGGFEFVFPMVVGPRFNPPGHTDGVGAVARGKPGRSGHPVEVQYLAPDERSGHDIGLTLEIDAGVSIEDISCASHVVDVQRPAPTRATVSLSPRDTLPNKDFVLRYAVAGAKPKTAILTHEAEDGRYFALLLVPPAELTDVPRMPREMVFVVDCSGSMSGEPLAKAKAAMRRCLHNLDEDDTFQIIRFSESASALGGAPIPATTRNIKRGLRYLDSLRGQGGTMMIEGIKAALDFPHDEERLRIVSFMTDGYIGNEADILAAVKEKVGSARIFSFGVGSSVNRYLLERMAKMGRGTAAFVGLRDDAADKVDAFYERASRPALAKIHIDWGGAEVGDLYPQAIPDLFVGRPLLVVGRFSSDPPAQVRIQGRMGTRAAEHTLALNPDDGPTDHPGIRTVWARWRLADLHEQQITAPSDALREEMTETSLAYRVLCRYTAFLAVDSLEPTAGDHGVTVAVPVPTPEGVRYETTVAE